MTGLQSKWGKLAMVVLMPGLLSGCATHSQRADLSLQQFAQGDVEQALAFFEKRSNHRNRYLYLMETGRMRQLSGDFVGSRSAFNEVIDHLILREEGAVIRLRDVGGGALASTLTDDRMRPYVIARFEAVMLFVAQAVNHLVLGEPEAAWVQLRRAAVIQEMWLEEAAREAPQEFENEQEQEFFEKSMERLRTQSENLVATAARVANSQENPFAWYMIGVMFEQQGDINGAYQAFRRAAEMMPDNATLRRDYLRLGLRVDRSAYARRIRDAGGQIEDYNRPSAEVLILFDENLISRRREERLPIYTGNWQMFALPFYADPPYRPSLLRASIDGGASANLQPAVFLQSLAYRDLEEQMTGMVLRNITRAVARQVVYSTTQQSDQALINLLGVIFNITALMADAADTRSWYSLPMAVQLVRLPVEPGDRVLRIANPQTGREHQVELAVSRGQLQLVWIADIGARSILAVAGMDRVVPAHVSQVPSLLSGRGTATDDAAIAAIKSRHEVFGDEWTVDLGASGSIQKK